jgi:hypothetical protein
MRICVEFSFKSVLCHVHAFRNGSLAHTTHDGDRLRLHLLIKLRHAHFELECSVFQMPGSHGNVIGTVDILVYDFDGFCLQTEANNPSQRIPTQIRQRQLQPLRLRHSGQSGRQCSGECGSTLLCTQGQIRRLGYPVVGDKHSVELAVGDRKSARGSDG